MSVVIWDKWYQYALEYYQKYGNLLVPYSYKTEDGKALGRWISHQREAYHGKGTYSLSEKQIQKLNDIKMIWNSKEYKKMSKYRMAEDYYKHYNNLLIPTSFKTKNGYEYSEDGCALGVWIENLRVKYKNGELSLAETQKLEKIKMVWDVYDYLWNQNYQLAQSYYEHYHHLLIPHFFRTKNGYDYDPTGEALGAWIATQRQAYFGKTEQKMKEDRIQKLNQIRMIWSVRLSNLLEEQIKENNLKYILYKLQWRFEEFLETYDGSQLLTRDDVIEIEDGFQKKLNFSRK